MKIEKLSSEILKLVGEELRQAKKKENEGKSKNVEISISGISVNITKEVQEISYEPPSKEKVEEIKKAIAEGKYQVNVHKISEALIREIIGD